MFVLTCTCVALFLQSRLMDRRDGSASSRPEPDQAQCSRELFTAWALAHGIVHPNLKLGMFQLEGAGGNVSVRGVATGLSLGVDDAVVAIPKRVVFTPDNAYLQASPVQALLRAMPYKDDYPVLAMHLLYEQQRGMGGMFWPWICTLPSLASFERSFPLFWEARPSKLDRIEPAIRKWVTKANRNLRRQWERISDMISVGFQDLCHDRGIWTFDNYRWAMALVQSRNFWMDDRNVMTPVADSLNHKQALALALARQLEIGSVSALPVRCESNAAISAFSASPCLKSLVNDSALLVELLWVVARANLADFYHTVLPITLQGMSRATFEQRESITGGMEEYFVIKSNVQYNAGDQVCHSARAAAPIPRQLRYRLPSAAARLHAAVPIGVCFAQRPWWYGAVRAQFEREL